MKPETVAASFATYQARVLPQDAPLIQVDECRKAFYAGAYFLLMNLAHNIGDDSTDLEQGIVELEALQAECEAFAKAGGMPPLVAVPRPVVPADVNYTTDDAEEIRPLLEDLGDRIGNALPAGWGFNLLLFTFGEKGSLFYISNGERADVISMMHEFIRRQSQ